jgi:hypothetical protein
MAAFTGTPTSASAYAAQISAEKAPALEVMGAMKVAFFDYTHSAGAGTGEVNLVSLPAGRIVIYSDLSRVVTSAYAATADLHLGFRAYTHQDGSAVAEDDNAFLDNADAGGGALDQAWVLPAGGVTELNSQGGITIYALIDTGNIENTDTLSGWVCYAMAA